MPVTILIGAQWGDEGKGRFVDWLAAEARIVARYGGGDNAGHTVAIDGEIYKLHLVPSGILHPGTVSVMGNGMVINPVNLLSEIERLREQGVTISPQNLVISSRAHIITPAHIELDRMKETARGSEAIGTTLRGIGPAYLDKVGRRGLRMGQMLDVESFAEAMQSLMEEHNITLVDGVDVAASVRQYINAAEKLRPFIQETAVYLNKNLREGARVVCEGAQGTLLDVDHGSYPFVTSSSPSVGGALTGLGVGPTQVDRVVGVAKAFSTRVGGGPMPTELNDAVANRLRGTGENYWDEFGTTTGRPRRTGWLDGVMLRYSAMINGFTELFLTKLDVLTGFEELKIAVAYELDGQQYEVPPPTISDIERATPIYETFPGWQKDISGARTAADLPKQALDYIKRVAELCEVPIPIVSVGPERQQIVQL
ncbi:MAG: adenylosuccinate synthase [Anaerolineae bacterium]|nr:adenylosuccinate synthase [Anaerolineae bacterium]